MQAAKVREKTMAIQKKDREFVASLAMTYTAACILKYGKDNVVLEEGVLVAQKLLEVIDHRLPNAARKRV